MILIHVSRPTGHMNYTSAPGADELGPRHVLLSPPRGDAAPGTYTTLTMNSTNTNLRASAFSVDTPQLSQDREPSDSNVVRLVFVFL